MLAREEPPTQADDLRGAVLVESLRAVQRRVDLILDNLIELTGSAASIRQRQDCMDQNIAAIMLQLGINPDEDE